MKIFDMSSAHAICWFNFCLETAIAFSWYIRLKGTFMIDYEAFEIEVERLNPNKARWQHILPAVPPHCRIRFLTLVKANVDIPAAYDMVLITQNQTEEEFEQRLKQYLP